MDGEAVVLNEEGKPDFDALQKFNGQPSGALICCFDLLWLNGASLLNVELAERKQKLKDLITGNESALKYSEAFR